MTEFNAYLYVAAGLLLLCIIVTFCGLYLAQHRKAQLLKESLKNLESLNTKLRAQRHDYLNHFQVIYGLMELGEYEEAKKYLKPVFQDIMKVSKALKTAQPAVNALLQVKMEAAEKRGIHFFLEVRSDLKAIPIEAWNLCKVLSNIIDNAVYVLSEASEIPEKKIEIEIYEDGSEYYFSVSNNGPAIPEALQKEIFKNGFTSKKEEGHGMGLYIVSGIVRDAGGKIALTSSAEKTNFLVKLPKKTE